MEKKHVVIGVSGGIAAYKACDLVSKLSKKDYEIKVIMTKHAQEFVKPINFESLSKHKCEVSLFDETNEDPIAHITLAKWADIMVLVPATANIIAKVVHGIADDIVSTTFLACHTKKGVGIMMKDALSRGCKKIIIGLGGSATNDGGMGILNEFGVRFYNSKRELLVPSVYALSQIAFIDKRYARLPKDVEIVCACDVKNYLLGKNGATYIFGKQKGIYLNQMAEVEKGMAHYCTKLKQTFHVNVNEFEGSGAAGGIGCVLLGVMKAKRTSGIDLVIEYSGLKNHLQDADLVITGEGQTDAQTLYGKLPLGIAQLARSYNVPCVCLSGALGLGYQSLYEQGMIGIFSSADRAMSFQMALQTGSEKLEALAFSLTKFMDGIRK